MSQYHPLHGPLQAVETGFPRFSTNLWRVPKIFSYQLHISPSSSSHVHRGHFQVHPPEAIVRQCGMGHQAVHQIHRAFLTCRGRPKGAMVRAVPGGDLGKNAGGSWAKWWVFFTLFKWGSINKNLSNCRALRKLEQQIMKGSISGSLIWLKQKYHFALPPNITNLISPISMLNCNSMTQAGGQRFLNYGFTGPRFLSYLCWRPFSQDSDSQPYWLTA